MRGQTLSIREKAYIGAARSLGAADLRIMFLDMAPAVSIGVLAARRPRSAIDRGATVFVLTGSSMPTFLVGLLLFFLFYRAAPGQHRPSGSSTSSCRG